MKLVAAFLTFMGISFTALGLAEQPNFFPTPQIDKKLVAPAMSDEEFAKDPMKAAVDFFRKRSENKACQDKMQKTKKDYATARTNLEKLVAEKASKEAIDEAEGKVKKARGLLLLRVEECGRCATQPIKGAIVINPLTRPKQVWAYSDGSCLLEGADAERIKSAFASISQSLQESKSYPKRNKGGISHVLDLQCYDKGQPTDKLIDSYICVDTGAFLPEKCLSYFFSNKIENVDSVGAKEFSLTYHSTTDNKPPNLDTKFKDITAAGEEKEIDGLFLPDVHGFWHVRYIDSKVYIRYATAADFQAIEKELLGVPETALSIGSPIIRQILLDTIVQVYERGGLEIM